MKRNEHDAHHHLAKTRRRTDTPVAYRRHDLGLFDYLVGLASGVSLIGGVFVAGLGAALHLPDRPAVTASILDTLDADPLTWWRMTKHIKTGVRVLP